MEDMTQAPGKGRATSGYTQVKVSVSPNLAAAFKAACSASGVSMAAVLSKHMAEYAFGKAGQGRPPRYATRRQRRAAVSRMAQQLAAVKEAEETYMDNIPENLQGSVNYENAEQAVSLMDEALDALDAIY
jgi:hypothetical protein